MIAVYRRRCISSPFKSPVVPEGVLFALNGGVALGLLPAPRFLASRRLTEGSLDWSSTLLCLLERLCPAEFPLNWCGRSMCSFPAWLTSAGPSADRHAGAGFPGWSPPSPSDCLPLLLPSLAAISALVEIGGTRWAFRVGKVVVFWPTKVVLG